MEGPPGCRLGRRPQDLRRRRRSADAKGRQEAINALAGTVPELFGGSADLSESNLTDVTGGGLFETDNPGGRNIRFGVREHAMGGIANGIALYGGFIPYAATFLVFSDYMRGAVRLAAITGLRVVYVWTHDSVAVGEDGPTHEPVEQVAALRAIPNLDVIRPGDANETAAAWCCAVERDDGPTALILSRQKLPVLAGTAEKARAGVARGGYVLRHASGDAARPDLILIGDGVRVAARCRRRRGAREGGHPDPRRQPAVLGAVRSAGRGLSRVDPATGGPQARCSRGPESVRLGALRRRRRRDRRHRPLRRVGPGGRGAAPLRLHRRTGHRDRPEGRPRRVSTAACPRSNVARNRAERRPRCASRWQPTMPGRS